MLLFFQKSPRLVLNKHFRYTGDTVSFGVMQIESDLVTLPNYKHESALLSTDIIRFSL